MLNLFLASLWDLSVADGEMARAWGGFVEGLFENRGMDGDAVIFLNLLDDLKYRVKLQHGTRSLRRLPKRGFVYVRLVPVRPGTPAWLVSGMMRTFARSDAAKVAQVAIQLAANAPERVFRNPEKVEQGWKMMREDRAAFVGFFGTDELVLPPAEAAERMRAYYRHRQETQLAAQSKRGRPHNIPDLSESASSRLRRRQSDTSAASTTRSTDSTTTTTTTGCCGTCSRTRASCRPALRKRAARVPGVGHHRPAPVRRLVAANRQPPTPLPQDPAQAHLHLGRHGEALLRKAKPWTNEERSRAPDPRSSAIDSRATAIRKA